MEKKISFKSSVRNATYTMTFKGGICKLVVNENGKKTVLCEKELGGEYDCYRVPMTYLPYVNSNEGEWTRQRNRAIIKEIIETGKTNYLYSTTITHHSGYTTADDGKYHKERVVCKSFPTVRVEKCGNTVYGFYNDEGKTNTDFVCLSDTTDIDIAISKVVEMVKKLIIEASI